MLLTLNAASLRSLITPKRSGRRDLELADLPKYVHETLGLNGLNLTTDMLKGLGRSALEQLRDQGDKAGCTVLLLSELTPQKLGSQTESQRIAAVDRVQRVVEAARLLGCSSISVPVDSAASDNAEETTIDSLKEVMERADKLDINVLLAPHKGLTADPDRMTEVIKKVGGFRVGCFPDFETAAAEKDPELYLKRLTPYASAVSASVIDFEVTVAEPPEKPAAADQPEEELDDSDPLARLEADIEALLGPDDEDEGPEEQVTHKPYDLVPLVRAILAVGFDGSLSIDYRGKGDGVMGVLHARTAIEQAIDLATAEA